jgi:HEAT repeat protein
MRLALTFSLATLLLCTAATAAGQTPASKEVAALLGSEEFKYEDDDSPVYALAEMGVTAEYAGEIAGVLGDEFWGEVAKAAAYALAGIGAKQYAKDVAKLLDDKYRRGDAAKALALMGADEYKGRIAQLLDDEDSLVRKDALLALGILNAREYIPRIAKFLKDLSFVSNFAAGALVLMDAGQYARDCVPLVEKAYESGLYLGADEFHPLAEEQLGKYRARFAQSFLRMRSQLAK